MLVSKTETQSYWELSNICILEKQCIPFVLFCNEQANIYWKFIQILLLYIDMKASIKLNRWIPLYTPWPLAFMKYRKNFHIFSFFNLIFKCSSLFTFYSILTYYGILHLPLVFQEWNREFMNKIYCLITFPFLYKSCLTTSTMHIHMYICNILANLKLKYIHT